MIKSNETKHQIRPLQETDAKFIKGLYQNSEIMRHISPVLSDDLVLNLCEKMLSEMYNNKALYQVIMTENFQQEAGLLSMHWRPEERSVECGMIIIPKYQNQGICKWAQFAGMKMIKSIFPAKKCIVYISHENKAANMSYEHMGFVPVANNSNKKRHANHQCWEFNLESVNER